MKSILSTTSIVVSFFLLQGCEIPQDLDLNQTTTTEQQGPGQNQGGDDLNQGQGQNQGQDQTKDQPKDDTTKTQGPKAQVKEIQLSVNASADDAEENTEGVVNLKSTDLELVEEKHDSQIIGIRFTDLDIPKDAKIVEAHLQFTTDEASSDTTYIKIQVEQTPNATSFTKSYYDVSSRDLFEQEVEWYPEAWSVAGESGEKQTTPDLSSLLQQVISQPQWQQGNAVAFIISGEGKRVAESYDGASNNGAPKLIVSYTLGNGHDNNNHINNDRNNGTNDDMNNNQNNGYDDSTKKDNNNGFDGYDNGTNNDMNDNQDNGYDDSTKKDNNNRTKTKNNHKNDTKNNQDDGYNNGTKDDMNDNQDNSDNQDNGYDDSTKKDNTKTKTKTDNTDKQATDDKATPIVKYPRIVWDHNPSQEATIGFTPLKRNNSYTIRYGYTTDESLWESKSVDKKHSFDRSLSSNFVTLSNLTPNKDVYFRICNDTQCGQRMWFKTAPDDDTPFVFVAGGDTRSGWDTRRAGNDLISKIRPLFVMHGGDFTNGNSAKEMDAFLKDWTKAYSHDNIDGKEYTRVYPIVPAHGNHEDGNLETLCEVFGTDSNRDGQCTSEDTYGAFSVGSLLRVYTLNSQYKYSSRERLASAMNQWFEDDINNNGNSTQWRIVQYHKPMFPHYSGKHTNPTLHSWWAQLFYDKSVNLVIESDTHIAKATTTVKPSGDGFVATKKGGTMYVGEGSWGAPARSANRAYDWTLDLASIQQFKVVTVTKNSMDVRTAEFDGRVRGLSKADREADTTKLPSGIHWWSIDSKGDVLRLTPDSHKRSILK